MEKQRLFKMIEIERNMLVKALGDIRGNVGRSTGAVDSLITKTTKAPERKLYLSDPEYRWSMDALNVLRSAYLSAGRYSDGIDSVILKLMKTKYRRVPAR